MCTRCRAKKRRSGSLHRHRPESERSKGELDRYVLARYFVTIALSMVSGESTLHCPFCTLAFFHTDLWDIIDQECLLLMFAHLRSLASEAHPPCGCLGHVHRHLAAHVHMRPANREGMAHWLGGYRSRAWVLSYLASRQMPNASFGSSSWSA